MENYTRESSIPIEKALKEAGFAVEKTVKQGKKTVITVTQKLSQGEGQRGDKRLGSKKG